MSKVTAAVSIETLEFRVVAGDARGPGPVAGSASRAGGMRSMLAGSASIVTDFFSSPEEGLRADL